MVAAQAGDKAAYKQVLSESSEMIRGFLYARISNRQAADEIVQEALLAIHKARHTYDPRRPFIPWMMTLARYKYVDYLRKWEKTQKLEVGDEQLEQMAVTKQASSANEQLGEVMSKALNMLSEEQRTLVLALKVEGLSVRDMADKLGKSEAAVKVSAHRAYKKLRQKLEKLGYEY